MTAASIAAREAAAAGLCVIPPRQDGSKAPDVASWTRYQQHRPTEADLDTWYANGRTGVGIVAGRVSGGLEMLELEGRAVAEGIDKELRALAKAAGLLPLLQRITTGYAERTPSGGWHFLFRVHTPLGNLKLARRPATADELAKDPADRVRVLIETRGEGGYVVVAPSSGPVHPTGEPWVLRSGSFATIATITDEERDELYRLCRTLDSVPVEERPPRRDQTAQDGDRPGDRYNALPDAHERTLTILERHGWVRVFSRGGTDYLRRPGKDHGISATLGHNAPGQLVVFSTSAAPFEATSIDSKRGYSAFAVYGLLEHGGDWSAAARAIAEELDGPGIRFTSSGERGRAEDDPAPDPDEDGDDLAHRLGARALSDIDHSPPKPLLLDRLDPEEDTVLFGDGGTGKGVLAAAWIVGLVMAGHRVLVIDYENHPAEWSRRIRALGGAEVTKAVIHVSPTGRDWQGRRGAIWDHQEDLRRLADATEATYCVIDSAAVACGAADSMKPDAPGRYFPALRYIGRPTLSLAHSTKADAMKHPFGSVFWHNLCRVSWSLERGGGEGHRVILTHRKGNNVERIGRLLVTVTWRDGVPGEVAEERYSAKLAERITAILRGGFLTLAELTQRLNDEADEDEPTVKANTVRTTLRRGISGTPKLYTVEGTGRGARFGNAS